MAWFSFQNLKAVGSRALARSRKSRRKRISVRMVQAEVLEDRRLLSASVATGQEGGSTDSQDAPAAMDATSALNQVPPAHSASGWIADAEGDFLSTYTGPHDPGLDVIAHRVMVLPNRVIFSAKMAGPIAPTEALGGLYLFGMDRGQGTPRFRGGTPLIGPNVKWDLIVRINPNGTGLVNNQVAGVVTPLDPADIHIDDNGFTASVPLSVLLPASTRPPSEWTYNLWPRNNVVPGQNQHVSDLAPDDGNSPVRTLPPQSPVSASSLQGAALANEVTHSTITTLPAGLTRMDVAIEPSILNSPSTQIDTLPVVLLNFDDAGNDGPVIDTLADDGGPESLDFVWSDLQRLDEIL